MFWTLYDFAMSIDIVEPSSSYPDDKNINFSSPDEAARFLEQFTIHWDNYTSAQEAIRKVGESPQGSSHQEVAAHLSRLVVADRLRLRRSYSNEDRLFRTSFGMPLGIWGPRDPHKVTTSKPTEKEPKQKAKRLYVRLPVDPKSFDYDHYRFTVKSTDSKTSYQQIKKVSDDKIPGDEYVDLEYLNLIPDLSYTLIVELGDGVQYKAFENVPYSMLFA